MLLYDSNQPPLHLRAARELLEHVLPEDNSYTRHQVKVTWKGVDGAEKYSCHTTCSGLLDALFEHSYGLTEKHLERWLGRKEPKSREYFQAIVDQNGFTQIRQVYQIHVGDILAIRFLSPAENAKDATGHVMIVDEVPIEIPAAPPIIPGTTQWSIAVIDCAHRPHGKRDSRYVSPGQHLSGIGKSYLRLYSDVTGELIGYTRSMKKEARMHGPPDRPIVAGRLILNFQSPK